jgi:lipopolysaccharide export system protein LptA
LIDDVVFFHAGAEMYCDSAYMFTQTNSFDAYNNIYINQGDTVKLFGNFLHYDGNTKLATITGNVKLINKETTLKTDKLEYDLGKSIGYYKNHADIVNNENKLESRIGYYYAHQKLFHFIDSVVITNPDYKMYSDTLNYNTDSRIAYFLGPTNIIGDSSHIYCENGWYDIKKDISELRDNAWAENNQQTVKGNYIYYDKKTKEGLAKSSVVIIDKEKNIVLKGNYARYNELTEYAFLTDKAEFIQISENDSLFLHADTLKTFPDTSGSKVIYGFHHVKFFRENVQGMCDSLVYTFSDSVARMFKYPVLWMDNYQVSAEKIDMFTKNKQLDKMMLYKSSFIISQEDTAHYNQIKGKDMRCYFVNNDISRIDVSGNGQTIYYAKDGPDIVGVNKIECSNMILHFANNNIHKINFYINPVGTLYPLDQAPENESKLKGFQWLVNERPKSKSDIF